MKKIVIIVFLLTLIIPAYAGEWLQAGKDSYIRVSSIRYSKGMKRVHAWVRKYNLKFNPSYPTVFFEDDFIQIECSSKKATLKQYYLYNKNADLLYISEEVNESGTIKPGTRGELLYNSLCKAGE